MLSRSVLHRPAAVLAAVALAAGVAGCGGSDDGDGGSGGGAYASTWNEVCTSLSAAQAQLQKDGAEVQKTVTNPSEATLAKAFAKPVTTFADSMSAALDRVKDLEAPDEFSSFQDQVAKSAPSTISTLEKVKGPFAEGDVQATQQVIGRIDQKNVFPAIPAELKKQAAACNAF